MTVTHAVGHTNRHNSPRRPARSCATSASTTRQPCHPDFERADLLDPGQRDEGLERAVDPVVFHSPTNLQLVDIAKDEWISNLLGSGEGSVLAR